MRAVRKSSSWAYNIPNFEMSDRFTYFLSLNNEEILSKNSEIPRKRKIALYEASTAAAQEVASSLTVDSITMDSALNFLKQVAESERKKELQIFKQYKDSLKKKFPQKRFAKIFKVLESTNLDNPNLDSFYEALTSAINLIRQESNEYLNRLKRLKSHNYKQMNELQQDTYLFRAQGDIQALNNSLIGMATQSQQDSSFAAKLRRTIMDHYVIPHNIIEAVSCGEDYVAILDLITLDIERKLQEVLDKEGKKDFTEITDKIEEVVDNYANAVGKDQTRFQKVMSENGEELEDILQATKSILGISTIKGEENIKKRNRQVGQRISRLSEEQSLYKRMSKDPALKKIQEELKHVTITSASSTSHGNLFEVIELLIQKGFKVSGNAATDIISIGSISFDILLPNIQNLISDYTKRTTNYFSQNAKQHRKDRLHERDTEIKEMNEAIRNAETQLNDTLKNLDANIENIFIYHESLKLYKGMEIGQSDAFHGRSMQLLGYLEELYSLNGIEDLILPDKNALIFLSQNLSKLAVGGDFKEPLEKYLSIFAGLIMFDDISNIALDSAQMLKNEQNGPIKNIHLYNLNGVYVPGSMILSYTYENMKNIQNMAQSGRGANAKIYTSGIDTAIKKFEDEHPAPFGHIKGESYSSYWPQIGEAAVSGTTIRVAFLSSFNAFLNKLIEI